MSDSVATDDQSINPADFKVLIVDNDVALARAMLEALEKVGYRCTLATGGPEGKRQIEQDTFDIVITDMVMNDVDGMQILALAKQLLPEAEVIMVTGHATVTKAVEAMQIGAFNFLEKPITPAKLRTVTAKAAEQLTLKQTNIELRRRLDERYGFEGLIYSSPAMHSLVDRLRRISQTDATVLITGESGTGKEVVARAIHQNSPRKNKRLVALNVRAVSENLVESELFGHVRGSFTDAVSDREGAFQYADGGTLFLDEVGDMPMSTQIKLLRVLEEGQITRVGDNKPIKVNVRLLSATNRPLEQMIEEGTFRLDLYYRLKVLTVQLPPLRQRREDIIPLMDHFRKMFLKRHGKSSATFTPAVTRLFYGFDWPGNVRQLRNFVETMTVLDHDGRLDLDDLPPELSPGPMSGFASENSEASTDIDSDTSTGANTPFGEPQSAETSTDQLPELLGKTMDEIERWAIEQTLVLTGGNREEAAKILKIGARTLYRKLDKYKQDDEASQ